jgi:transposase-like protein
VLDAWRASGESVTGFAQRHGLVPQRLCWWRQRLDEAAPTKEEAAVVQSQDETPAFVPVEVRAAEPIADLAVVVVGADLRVEVRGLDATSAAWVETITKKRGVGIAPSAIAAA